jgi:hypothetical protein
LLVLPLRAAAAAAAAAHKPWVKNRNPKGSPRRTLALHTKAKQPDLAGPVSLQLIQLMFEID